MIIGIDIDGVLTNLEEFQLDCGSKFMSENFNKSITDANAYDTIDIFNINSEIDDKFWSIYLPLYVKEPARKYADEVTNKLHDDGFQIYIITARYLTNRNDEKGIEMRKTVIDWLKSNNIYYDKIIFSPEDKLDICKKANVDLMIEDKVDNINKISKYIHVICFDSKYNKICQGTNIIRCYSWYDIYAKISNIFKK